MFRWIGSTSPSEHANDPVARPIEPHEPRFIPPGSRPPIPANLRVAEAVRRESRLEDFVPAAPERDSGLPGGAEVLRCRARPGRRATSGGGSSRSSRRLRGPDPNVPGDILPEVDYFSAGSAVVIDPGLQLGDDRTPAPVWPRPAAGPRPDDEGRPVSSRNPGSGQRRVSRVDPLAHQQVVFNEGTVIGLPRRSVATIIRSLLSGRVELGQEGGAWAVFRSVGDSATPISTSLRPRRAATTFSLGRRRSFDVGRARTCMRNRKTSPARRDPVWRRRSIVHAEEVDAAKCGSHRRARTAVPVRRMTAKDRAPRSTSSPPPQFASIPIQRATQSSGCEETHLP